jgi:hypothetical protein
MSWVGQTSDQIRARARIRSRADKDAQPLRFDRDATEREAETADARLVQPLQVVDDERDRLRLAQLLQQASDSQRYREGVHLATDWFDPLQSNCQGTLLRTRQAPVRPLWTLAEQVCKTRKR